MRGQARKEPRAFLAVLKGSEGFPRGGLDGALVGRHPYDYDPDIEQNVEESEGDDDAGEGCVDRPHVSGKSTGEEKQGDLVYDRETLDEEVEWPPLQAVAFALAVTTLFDHRSTGVGGICSATTCPALPRMWPTATSEDPPVEDPRL